jgi:hypothetical protein
MHRVSTIAAAATAIRRTFAASVIFATVCFLASFAAVPAHAATGTLSIGGATVVSDLANDGSGTSGSVSWTWTASTATLTLTNSGTIADVGDITFEAVGDVTVTVGGGASVTATAISNDKTGAGKLTVNGSGTLTVSKTGNTYPAIRAGAGLEIAYVTVSASTAGNYSDVMSINNGDFTMSSGTLNFSATGNASAGINCRHGNILISGTAQVTGSPVSSIGMVASGNIEISGGTVNVASTNSQGILAGGEVRISGGAVTAKGKTETSAYCYSIVGETGITVSGGSLITGDPGASPANGDVGGNLTVSGGATNVTVNGSLCQDYKGGGSYVSNLNVSDGTVAVTGNVTGDLSVSGGAATVTGTVSGVTAVTGGTVSVNGAPVTPSVTDITVAAITITAPVTGATPVTTATISGTGYTCSAVTWTPTVTGGKFLGSTGYTASVTLTAASGYQFSIVSTQYKINDDGANPTNVTATNATLSYSFSNTDAETVSAPPSVPVFHGLADEYTAGSPAVPLKVAGTGSESLTVFKVNGTAATELNPATAGAYRVEAASADGKLRIWKYVKVK